jgi:hypothetical protein
MDNLRELYDFLDGCDTEALLLRITGLTNHLNDRFGQDSDFRVKSYLDNLKKLYKLTKHQFEKQGTGIEKKDEKLNSNKMNSEPSIIEVLSEAIGKNEEPDPKPTIDQYKNMDSGDIDFVGSILPYTKNYIRGLCRDGILPYEKPRGKYIFNRSKIEEWKKQHGSEYRKELLGIGKRTTTGETKKN